MRKTGSTELLFVFVFANSIDDETAQQHDSTASRCFVEKNYLHWIISEQVHHSIKYNMRN